MGAVPRSDDKIPQIVTAAASRARSIVECLSELDDTALLSASELPGWSRLTIACHLRYGANALRAMTESTLMGRPAAYYPEGRAVQRPGTLTPLPGETPHAVIASLATAGEELHRLWSSLDPSEWNREITEPPRNVDLGPVPLSRLPLMRLTELEVHGTDLGAGLGDWGELFVLVVLPLRLDWLPTRRTNHRDFDREIKGSWLLVATDGPTYRVSVDGIHVESQRARPDSAATSTITAPSRDLLALLLGRPFRTPAIISGDTQFGTAFSAAFPGP
jgi:uncharacterized protein (TIGR03083 family)